MSNSNNNKFITLIVIAVIIGFLGGVVGELVARVYWFEDAFKIPFFGEINLSNTGSGGPGIIIRDAKKVIVEQNSKINETVISVSGSMAGLYKKKATSSNPAGAAGDKAGPVNEILQQSYQAENKLATGFIITSDGWIIADYVPADYAELASAPDTEASRKQMRAIAGEYVFITSQKVIYEVDGIVVDNLSGYAFWHIKAIDLPVREFSELDNIKNGSLVIAVNWEKWVFPASIVGQIYNGKGLVRSSDLAKHKLVIGQDIPDEFLGSFVFEINGHLIGVIGNSGEIFAVTNFIKPINSLLKSQTISRVSLGVNYIDVSELYLPENQEIKQGALISAGENGAAVKKGSPADKAGLREGDIIISVDNIKLDKDNNLTKIIGKYLPGDNLNLLYLRGGETREVKIELAEL